MHFRIKLENTRSVKKSSSFGLSGASNRTALVTDPLAASFLPQLLSVTEKISPNGASYRFVRNM